MNIKIYFDLKRLTGCRDQENNGTLKENKIPNFFIYEVETLSVADPSGWKFLTLYMRELRSLR